MRKKQTKIVVTLASQISSESLKELYDNGMDVVRINTAHQQLEEASAFIAKIRGVSKKIAVLLDTKGPELRSRMVDHPVQLRKGMHLQVRGGEREQVCTDKELFVSFNILPYVDVGQQLLVDDGSLELVIKEKRDDYVVAEVINDGELKSFKSINIPGAHIPLPSLTERDKAFVMFACEQDIEFIAHSFVRHVDDVKALREEIKKHNGRCKIIAKIENQEGVDNLEEILPHVYGVMVARGDLGVELPFEEIPKVQKNIIRTCIQWGKPVITATQMLQSMIDHPRATRAEISDVANAIYDGTDAVMLSGETAYGKYPVESVRTMATVAKQVESDKRAFRRNDKLVWKDDRHKFFGRQAIQACYELPVKGIVAMTWTGATARLLSAFRGNIPIYAKCLTERTSRELALVYGVYPCVITPQYDTDSLVATALNSMQERKECLADDLLVILGAAPGKEYGVDFLEINTLKEALSHVGQDHNH